MSFLAFYLQSFYFFDYVLCYLTSHGTVGTAFVDVDAANLAAVDASVLGEETEHIAISDLVFLAAADVD